MDQFMGIFHKASCRDTFDSACSFLGSSLAIMADTMDGVICIPPRRDSFISAKSRKEEKLPGKHSALSTEDANTSN